MTLAKLEKIVAGPELNKLIGQKVFNYSIYHYDKDVTVYADTCPLAICRAVVAFLNEQEADWLRYLDR